MGIDSTMHNKGFTLIELIIVIAITGIIAVAVGYILLTTVDAWTFKFNRNDLLWDGRLGMDRMVREIREIKNKAKVTTASTSEFRFENVDDLDITYNLNGTNLNRIEDGVTNLLAENVSALTFTYYDVNGDTIVVPDVAPGSTNIRRIGIDLTLKKNNESFYLQSQSVPRNL